jgi:uncharacterized repeat protein (TIGR02543 family)
LGFGFLSCDNGGGDNSTTGKYTVTFSASGGAVTPETMSVDADSAVGELPTPTYEGKKFVGWFPSASDFSVLFTAETKITENITVTAQWVDDITPGSQEDGSYILDPSGFTVWYGAEIKEDGTIRYFNTEATGEQEAQGAGGVDYSFPTEDFDIGEYESLEIKYFTYAWTPEEEVSSKDNMQLTIKAGDNRTDTGDYPTLSKGNGTFAITGSNFAKFQTAEITKFTIAANVHNHAGINNYMVKIYSMKLNPKPAPAAEGSFGKQANGAYVLDPSLFKTWYNASLIGGDTISFTGGGMNYLFPTDDEDFDIADYESLTVSYTTSDIPAEEDGKSLKLTVHTLTVGDSDYTHANLTYPTLAEGEGNFSIDDTNFAALQADGIVGFDFQINSDGGHTTYKMKINSMTLNPSTGE